MKVDAYASRHSYWRHLKPIVVALEERGHEVEEWHPQGIETAWNRPLDGKRKADNEWMIVASEPDAKKFAASHRLIYVEHGTGQTYVGLPAGFAGGPGLAAVELFICPAERVADHWHRTYPRAATAVVGDPALDGLVNRSCGIAYWTAHWRCGANFETWPALQHHLPGLPALRDALAERGIELVGHAHPRDARRMADRWRQLGIRYEPDIDTVLRTGDLLIADNTSALYEAAALGMPVLCLNRPEYRRNIEHGLRFWSYVPGLMCDEPHNLTAFAGLALEDSTNLREQRERAVAHAYAHLDGKAARYAAAAIEGTIDE
jgi:hypothetical protein